MSFDSLAADNPAHGGITTQTIGIVHVVVSAKTAKDGLTELTRYAVPSILAGTAVVENTLGHQSPRASSRSR